MTYDEWKAKQAAAVAAVACPRCKAPVGERCQWGTTSNGSVHTPRMNRYMRRGMVSATLNPGDRS